MATRIGHFNGKKVSFLEICRAAKYKQCFMKKKSVIFFMVVGNLLTPVNLLYYIPKNKNVLHRFSSYCDLI